MRVRVEGAGKLDLADELREEFVKDARDAVTRAADVLLRESRRAIEAYGPGPAPAGSTPGTESGNLSRLTKRRAGTLGSDKASASARVVYAPHSWLVEYGHMAADGTRVLPRPFVRPAEEASRDEIERILREALG